MQRASVHIHTLLFFCNKPSVEPAYVLSVDAHSVNVLVPRFGIEGTIYMKDIVVKSFAKELKYAEKMAIKSGASSESNSDLFSQLIDFNADLHTVSVVSATATRSVLLCLQVFQKVMVHICVEQNVQMGSRRLVMSLLGGEEVGAVDVLPAPVVVNVSSATAQQVTDTVNGSSEEEEDCDEDCSDKKGLQKRENPTDNKKAKKSKRQKLRKK